MSSKSSWYARLDQIVADLEALPSPWITRGTVEFLFGVGPRRAQQLMASCATEQVGTSIVADRELLIAHLRSIAHGETAHYETQRRRKFGRAIDQLRQSWISAPKVLVEAPTTVVNQDFDDLPAGLELAPGRITLSFDHPSEALAKLLALAMAIGNDMDRFERLTSVSLAGSPVLREDP
jgi:hypothetical protein